VAFEPDSFVARILPRVAPKRLLARAPVAAALAALDRPTHLACLGKPAVAFARALGGGFERTLTVGPRGSGADFEGGHPLPDEGSFRAGAALLEFAATVPRDHAFLFFVAGGGSALAEVPACDDIVARTDALLRSGAPIAEINRARQRMSRLKGGALGRACPAARKLTLVLCDVPSGDLSLVASGPVLDGEIVRVGGYAELAAAAVEVLRRSGIVGVDLAPALDEGIEAGVARHRDWIRRHARPAPWALVSGGELPVAVRGGGRGGRNSEFVVRMADALRDAPGRWRVLALATDGDDGNSGAAGGWIDPRRLRPDEAADSIARSDTASLLDRRGHLFRPGRTDTNLMDLRVLVRDL